MKRIIPALLAFAIASQGPVAAAAESADYDRYTSEMAYAPDTSSLKQIALEFPSYPFELIRWPVDKTLVFIEDQRIPAKTLYIYENLVDYGIKPKIGFTSQGLELDIPRAFRLKQHLPAEVLAKTWVSYSIEKIFDTGAKVGYGSEETGFHAYGMAQYIRRPDEDFFGLGSETSSGDEADFTTEETKFEAVTGYTKQGLFRLDARSAYRNIDIGTGEDKDEIDFFNYHYNDRSIPSIGGDKILNAGLDLSWIPFPDQDMVYPGKALLSAEFNEGLHESNVRYFKIVADVSKHIKLGTDRRILSMRFYGEHNNALKGRDIPFYQMARLGGFGTYPYQSQTLRGFEANRFIDENAMLFNIEYCYRVYENRNWKVTQVLFFDEGQVFQRFGGFKFGDFRESYGGGFRLDYLQHCLLDVEMAFGEEGPMFYLKTRRPF